MNEDQTSLPATPKRVLCVEDEHFINELYARALTKAGYQTTVVTDGEQALQEILSDEYDIVLLDIMLPSLIGTEVLKRIRADKPDLKAKIIITTNLELSEENRAAIEAQADGYVVKADLTPRQMAEFLAQLNV
ncbi:response regulator [Candidatus Saccharibacteria bacterium]|nr:response regulator [Candidatus Saccharibacteria bacterium]